jgi:hypothetical protein
VEALCFALDNDSMRGIVAQWVMASVPSVGDAGPMNVMALAASTVKGAMCATCWRWRTLAWLLWLVLASMEEGEKAQSAVLAVRLLPRHVSALAVGVEVNVDLQPWSIGGLRLSPTGAIQMWYAM